MICAFENLDVIGNDEDKVPFVRWRKPGESGEPRDQPCFDVMCVVTRKLKHIQPVTVENKGAKRNYIFRRWYIIDVLLGVKFRKILVSVLAGVRRANIEGSPTVQSILMRCLQCLVLDRTVT